jgi:hypothetical protein
MASDELSGRRQSSTKPRDFVETWAALTVVEHRLGRSHSRGPIELQDRVKADLGHKFAVAFSGSTDIQRIAKTSTQLMELGANLGREVDRMIAAGTSVVESSDMHPEALERVLQTRLVRQAQDLWGEEKVPDLEAACLGAEQRFEQLLDEASAYKFNLDQLDRVVRWAGQDRGGHLH